MTGSPHLGQRLVSFRFLVKRICLIPGVDMLYGGQNSKEDHVYG